MSLIHKKDGREFIRFIYNFYPFLIIGIFFYIHFLIMPYVLIDVGFESDLRKNYFLYTQKVGNIFDKFVASPNWKFVKLLANSEKAYLLFSILTLVLTFDFIGKKRNPFRKLYLSLIYNTTAELAEAEDIKYMNLHKEKEKGFLLGFLGRTGIYLKETLSVLIVAPPGAGKTQSLIRMIESGKNHSWVILDIKRELYEKTSKFQAEHSSILLLEPSNPDSIAWNPFLNLPKDNEGKEQYALKIAEVLFQSKGQEKDKFFSESAKEVFNNIALALIELQGTTNIYEIISTLEPDPSSVIRQKDAGEEDMHGGMFKIKELAERLETVINDENRNYIEKIQSGLIKMSSQANETFGGIMQTFSTKTNVFKNENIIRIISQENSFDFDTLRGVDGKPVTLYVVIKQDEVDSLAIFIKLFFEMIALHFLSQDSENAKKGFPITLGIDEFSRWGYLKTILNMPQLCRSQRINPIIITQTINQLKDIYGQNGVDALLGNAYALICLGSSEDYLIDKISKNSGTYEVEEKRRSSYMFSSNPTPTSTDKKAVPLITAQMVSSLPNDQAIIMIQGFFNRPIIAKRLFVYNPKTRKIDHKIQKIMGMVKDKEVNQIIKTNQVSTKEKITPEDKTNYAQKLENSSSSEEIEQVTRTIQEEEPDPLNELTEEEKNNSSGGINVAEVKTNKFNQEVDDYEDDNKLINDVKKQKKKRREEEEEQKKVDELLEIERKENVTENEKNTSTEQAQEILDRIKEFTKSNTKQ